MRILKFKRVKAAYSLKLHIFTYVYIQTYIYTPVEEISDSELLRKKLNGRKKLCDFN